MTYLHTRPSMPMIHPHRRRPVLASRTGLLLLASLIWSCGCGASTNTQAPQPARENSEPSKTTLKSGGCLIRIEKRDWSQVEEDGTGTATWATTDDGPENWLTVFPMEVNLRTPPEEWESDVKATLNLRRYADREQRGPQVDLSAIEFFAHPKYPGGYYTQLDAETGEGIITLTRLSQNLECVVFLVGELGTHEAMADRALRVLPTIEFVQE